MACQGGWYVIKLEGSLAPDLDEWFDGFSFIYLPGGDTLLKGWIVDQAALHGFLARIRTLNLKLISLSRVTEALDE